MAHTRTDQKQVQVKEEKLSIFILYEVVCIASVIAYENCSLMTLLLWFKHLHPIIKDYLRNQEILEVLPSPVRSNGSDTLLS